MVAFIFEFVAVFTRSSPELVLIPPWQEIQYGDDDEDAKRAKIRGSSLAMIFPAGFPIESGMTKIYKYSRVAKTSYSFTATATVYVFPCWSFS